MRIRGRVSRRRAACLGRSVLLGAFCIAAAELGGAAAPAGAPPPSAAPPGAVASPPEKKEEPSFVRDGVLDLEAVVKHFEDLYRSESSIARVSLTVVRPESERTLGMRSWTRGTEKALIVIQEPPRERGIATLKVEKNIWNFLPKINRTIRIPPSMMLSPWMGSDFTNDDLVRETSFKTDYTHELVGPSQEPLGWLVRFTAKEGVVGLWNRFELVVSPDGRTPIQSRWYDRKDRLARTIEWKDVKELGGRRLPSRLVLVPRDKEGHRTEMVYHEIEFDLDVPESTFSLSELERTR